jgi:hypothetical protein
MATAFLATDRPAYDPEPASGRSIHIILRLEGLAMAALSAVFYARTDASWWLFAALWLTPDLSMLGYLAGANWGAHLQRDSVLRNACDTGCVGSLAAHSYTCADRSDLDQSHWGGSPDGLRSQVSEWFQVDASGKAGWKG